MDRRERVGDPEETQRMIFEGQQAKIWTTIPGIVESFDEDAMTCVVQPAISGIRRLPNGDIVELKMPLLLDCPVQFPGGGGVTLTFPIKPGDECTVSFSARCIDSWWQLGGVQGQAEFRMHDLSDGFCLPGVRSKPRAFGVSTSTAQLRTDDGAAFVEIDPSSHKIKAQTSGDIEATSGGSIALSALTITLKGAIFLDGPVSQTNTSGGSTTATLIGPLNVTNDVTAGGKSLINHKHDVKNVQGGSATIASEKPT